MVKGNYYGLSEGLLLNEQDVQRLLAHGLPYSRVKRFLGGEELVDGKLRYCLWFPEANVDVALLEISEVADRIASVHRDRLASRDIMANRMADKPHQFREKNFSIKATIAVPTVSSEKREYMPVDMLNAQSVFSNMAFTLYDAPLWNMALIASKMHLVWIATVCGKLETRYRYSNTLGWNTFPVPPLTENQKAELTRCAEDILLAREAHFPATIADLYDPEKMPDNLRAAHDKNDETLERIYIGRRFKNDTERLEKLFDMYTKMIAKAEAGAKPKKAKKGAA